MERALRTLKHTLDLRPLYYRLPQHMDTHVLLVCLIERATGQGWK